MMTRKHYRRIAACIATLPASDQKQELIRCIASVLHEDNPAFSYAKFIAACYQNLDKNWIR